MYFKIKSIDIKLNLVERPELVSSGLSDLYKTLQVLDSDLPKDEKAVWQVRGIGNSEQYQICLNEIAHKIIERYPEESRETTANVLILVNKLVKEELSLSQLSLQELKIMLAEISKYNRRTLDTIKEYQSNGVVTLDSQDKAVIDDVINGTRCIGIDNFGLEITFESGDIVASLQVADKIEPLRELRLGRYINDLVQTTGGEYNKMPESIQFKDKNRYVGYIVDINVDYTQDLSKLHYILMYDQNGLCQKAYKEV